MIAIVSSVPAERVAFLELCLNRGWPVTTCDSVQAYRRLLSQREPRAAIVRSHLEDGYSDDIFAASHSVNAPTRFVLLLAAGTPSSTEARHIALGADCVLRDPVRTDVLIEYLLKFVNEPTRRPHRELRSGLSLAGGVVCSLTRTLEANGKCTTLTPRELSLAQLLTSSPGQVISYEILFEELLGRRFHGETSNMRVLLGKLCASGRKVGLDLRTCVKVIPKMGYCWTAPVEELSIAERQEQPDATPPAP